MQSKKTRDKLVLARKKPKILRCLELSRSSEESLKSYTQGPTRKGSDLERLLWPQYRAWTWSHPCWSNSLSHFLSYKKAKILNRVHKSQSLAQSGPGFLSSFNSISASLGLSIPVTVGFLPLLPKDQAHISTHSGTPTGLFTLPWSDLKDSFISG